MSSLYGLGKESLFTGFLTLTQGHLNQYYFVCFFFVRNHVADQVDILCGAFLGSGIDILFTISWLHDQDGRHTQIW